MKKKMVAMLLGLALAASTLGGCGEATVEDTTEVVEEIDETEEAEAEVEAEEVTEEAEVEVVFEAETEEATEEEDTEESEEAEEVEEETTEAEVETTTEAEVEETTETEVVYTYSEVTATMYAKQSVNVRDLPSTDGNRVGGLSTNQEVSVTGQCNETGWYRISYNGTDAYVSNNYLVSEKVATQTTTTTTQDTTTTTTQTETQQSTQTTETTSTATQVSTQSSSSSGESSQTFADWNSASAFCDTLRSQGYSDSSIRIGMDVFSGTYIVYYSDSTTTTTTTTTTNTVTASGYSTECVGYINDLRASVGVSSLTWSDSLAEVALARAQELAEAGALDGHAGLSKYGSYGENIGGSNVAKPTAWGAYYGWYNSEGHYNNMVNSGYTYVAVAYAENANGGFWVTIFQ